MFNLRGKRALITGGCGLLGPKHAQALLEAGIATVTLWDIAGEPLASATAEHFAKMYGIGRLFVQCVDVTDDYSVRNSFELTTPFDIVINNAAKDPKVTAAGKIDSSSLENTSLDQFKEGMDAIVNGTFLVSKYAAITMKPGSTIINIASDLSVIAPDQRIYDGSTKPIAYSAAKHAIVGMTKWLATYLAPRGIRVNCLSPTGVYNNHPAEFVTKLSNLIPMGRMADIDEYKGAIVFLASDASSYMTGHNLVIDGGKTIW